MLVLTRREQESIQIGTDVTLRVIRIRGNRVRLGIEAPCDIPITLEKLRATEATAAGGVDGGQKVDHYGGHK